MKPFYAISIHQPWAELILRGDKEFEYRSWHLPDAYEDVWLYLHTSKGMKKTNRQKVFSELGVADLVMGAYVGLVKFRRSEWLETPDDKRIKIFICITLYSSLVCDCGDNYFFIRRRICQLCKSFLRSVMSLRQ